MAKMADFPLRLVGCDESSSDELEDHEEGSGYCKRPLRVRQRAADIGEGRRHMLALWMCGAALVAIVVGVALWAPKLQGATEPTWEVKELVMRRVNIPALAIQGMAPADTSDCTALDPCGIASARGCSRCPDASMWNNGCVCQERDPGSKATAQPGTVVEADFSACPDDDRCGLMAARGCSKCPDDTWTNDGCTCRQAMSAEQFFHSVSNVARGIEGAVASVFGGSEKKPTTIEMELQAAVEVSNPNPIGATTGTGVFRIRYRGLEIGSADTDPVSIPAGGSTLLVVNVDVDNVPPDVGMMMLQEILQTGMQLALVVDGSVTASVNVLKVSCTAECKLRTDVSKLPNVSFTENRCTYGYSV